MRAAHAKRRGAGRAAFVKDKDLGICVALPLQRKQREQDGLARARGTDDQCVADIANVEVQPKRRGSVRLRLN